MLADLLVARTGRPFRPINRAGRPQRLAPGPVQREPAVVPAQAPPPHPRDLAQRAELVEQAWLIARDAGRQHVALQDRRRNREARELVDDLGEPLQRRRAAERWRDLASRR